MRTVLVLLACLPLLAQEAPRQAIQSKNGMVVCVCPIASKTGIEILKQGGNAVDAAVAVAFAEAVTWPEAGNIGGGGFMMIWPGNGKEPTCIDYREMAPALATKMLFADGKLNYLSPQAAGVPGTVRGLWMAHSQYGKLPWKTLLKPAIQLAKDGFTVDSPLAGRLNGVLTDGKSRNPEFLRIFTPPAGQWKAGDKLVQSDLAKTLQAISDSGPEGFYAGPVADLLEKNMIEIGGLIRKADLLKYQAIERKVLHGTYRGHDVYGAPPVSSGGTTLMLALNILEQFELKNPRQSAETIHLMAEAQRRAYVDRARHLGDPDFTLIPNHLYDKDYAKKLAGTIDLNHATKSETLAPEIEIKEGTSTTHFSVIDQSGMAVSNTYTLENAFGCRIVAPGTGFILNNEMTDFNPIPGTTTKTGKIGTEPNTIAPGKRMLSSMCPIFVAKDGKLLLITGSPGGRTIINTILCMAVNVIDYKMEIQAAVDEPRQHHQWFPDRLAIEHFPQRPELVKKLKAMGHTVTGHKQGDAHSIWIDPKTGLYHGAADKRLNGLASGY